MKASARVHVCPTAVPAESPESYYERESGWQGNAKFVLVGQYFNLTIFCLITA